MIQDINWKIFLCIIGGATAIYYSIILVIYYPSQVRNFLSGFGRIFSQHNRRFLNHNKSERKIESSGIVFESTNADDPSALFENTIKLVKEIEPVFENGYVKEELMMALQLILENYKTIIDTPFQIVVNKKIAKESETKCSICFSEQELNVLWRR